MKFIGTTGPIGHGKSTFADNVQLFEPTAVHFETGELISEVADQLHQQLESPLELSHIRGIAGYNRWLEKLPDILSSVVHVECDYDDISFNLTDVKENPLAFDKLFAHGYNLEQNFELARRRITPHNKDAYRPILQWLGGYLVQKVGPGIWFDELVSRGEAAGTQGAEICLIGALRFPSDEAIMRKAGAHIVKVYRPEQEEADLSDPTESSRDAITADTTIINNGSLADFTRTTEQFLADLKQGHAKLQYITTSS